MHSEDFPSALSSMHTERLECLEEERFARGVVADAEQDVVEHEFREGVSGHGSVDEPRSGAGLSLHSIGDRLAHHEPPARES
jgi:hypothetical protein